MYKKGFSVATIGIVLASMLAVISPAVAQVPRPASYLLVEYAWLKEDGVGPETWKQYNNTGWNRLNLSFRFSKADFAYVARSAATADSFTVTFIVYYNASGANGFNKTGHLFPGSTPVFTRTMPATSTQTAGLYTYHLFITVYDPLGVPGIYQLRINETGPGSGSDWNAPAGNPNVQWMFFFVPTTSPAITVTDQLGRPQPFYLDGSSPSTKFNATMKIKPPGNSTGATTASVKWYNPQGVQIGSTKTVPIYYVGGGEWAAQNVIPANISAFPFNASYPYSVQITMGYFVQGGSFYVLSTQWVQVTIDVTPIKNQWFDPSSFLVTFTAQVNTGMTYNPYQSVWNISLQFWDDVHYDLVAPWGVPEWKLGAVLANLSWNITGYPVVPGSSYTYTYTKMIPTTYIDNTTNRLGEFFGNYEIRSVPIAQFPAVTAKKAFYVDDPIEGYTSRAKASTTKVGIFEQKPATVWANVEYDPTYLRSRQHTNAVYKEKKTSITWHWYDGTVSPYLLRPPGTVQTTMTQDAAWPSSQFWAFSSALINTTRPIAAYWIIVNATTDNNYVVRELIVYNVVYKALYLKIWPKWPDYQPCMKKSIFGKTYYLDEFDNEVAVDWGFFIYRLVDPKGVVYTEPIDAPYYYDDDGRWYFPWTYTKKIAPSTEALGAVWDDLPSDAELGTWTVYAMVLGAWWDTTEVQTVGGLYSYQGPASCTFVVKGEDVHFMIDDILTAINETSNVTWTKLAEVMTKLNSISSQITSLKDTEIKSIITKVDAVMAKLTSMDTSINAKLTSIEDYSREIRALASRIDRWRTDVATMLTDNFAKVITEVKAVNSNINAKWTELGGLWDVTFWKTARDPRSLAWRIENAKGEVLTQLSAAIGTVISKVDTVNAGLAERLTNILNSIASEAGGLDASMKATIKENVNYAISSIREKVDQSTATLGTKIADAANGLHARFASVTSEIGYVSDKIDKVNEKVGGVESNIKDKVDAVDASVGTKLLVAIILIVIVLILCLLPIVAPGFRMKE